MSEKSTIVKDDYTIGELATKVAEHYRERKTLFYNVDLREVVRIGLVKMKVKDNGDEKSEIITLNGFIQINAEEFVTFLENDFDFVKIEEYKGNRYANKKNITASTANLILKSFDQFRMNICPIIKIFNVQMPFIQNNQLVLTNKGYDPKLLTWTAEDAPEIRKDMTLEEAKEVFRKIYGDFCFKEQQDYINAIALELTPYVRELYKKRSTRTPLGFYIANRERAGKDYCAGITGLVYEGLVVEDMPISSDKESSTEELRKKIMSTLIVGRNRFHSSNNRGYINNSVLESIITSENISDRELGKNKMLTFENILELSLSANTGITYSADLSRRSIFVNLFFSEEDPNARTFSIPDLHGYVKEHRGEILSANYALIRTWVEKGMPSCSKPFTSFPEWMRVVGGILEVCEIGIPTSNDTLNAGTGGDKETEDMKTLFILCHEEFREEFRPASDIFEVIIKNEDENLFSNFDLNNTGYKGTLAKKINRFVGRILGDIYLEKYTGITAKHIKYRFLSVKSEAFQRLNNQRGKKLYKNDENTPNSNNMLEKNHNYETFGGVEGVKGVVLPDLLKERLIQNPAENTPPTPPTPPDSNNMLELRDTSLINEKSEFYIKDEKSGSVGSVGSVANLHIEKRYNIYGVEITTNTTNTDNSNILLELPDTNSNTNNTPPNAQKRYLKDLRETILSNLKKYPEGLILSVEAKKWDLLYPLLKIYTKEDIDLVMRELITEEAILEKRNGVWALYYKKEDE